MIIGSIDVNTDIKWDQWSWPDFLDFYNGSLKGKVTETPEEVAVILGVKQITIKVK